MYGSLGPGLGKFWTNVTFLLNVHDWYKSMISWCGFRAHNGPKVRKTNAIYFQEFQFQIFPKLSPREVYKNLEKVSVSILKLMAVSVSISRLEKKSQSQSRIWDLQKKSLGLSLVVETTRKKSRSRSQNWDSIKENLNLGLETVNPVLPISDGCSWRSQIIYINNVCW